LSGDFRNISPAKAGHTPEQRKPLRSYILKNSEPEVKRQSGRRKSKIGRDEKN